VIELLLFFGVNVLYRVLTTPFIH